MAPRLSQNPWIVLLWTIAGALAAVGLVALALAYGDDDSLGVVDAVAAWAWLRMAALAAVAAAVVCALRWQPRSPHGGQDLQREAGDRDDDRDDDGPGVAPGT